MATSYASCRVRSTPPSGFLKKTSTAAMYRLSRSVFGPSARAFSMRAQPSPRALPRSGHWKGLSITTIAWPQCPIAHAGSAWSTASNAFRVSGK